MKKNRWKRLRVTSELLLALFSMDGSKRVQITGLPEDAEIVGVNHSPDFNEIGFNIASETFPEFVPPIQDIRMEMKEVKDIRGPEFL